MEIVIEESKRCSKCGVTKLADEFRWNNRALSRRESSCRSCMKRVNETLNQSIHATYHNLRKLSKSANVEFMSDKKELRDFLLNATDYEASFIEWTEDRTDLTKKPRVTRVDTTKGYTVDNLHIVFWNSSKNK